MIKLIFDGALSEWGKEFNLAATSPMDAIMALTHMLDGFKDYVSANEFYFFVNDDNVDMDGVVMATAKDITVRVMLAVSGGSGKSGLWTAIAGVALIGLALATGGVAAFGMSAATSKMLMIGVGASIAAIGIGQMIMPTIKMPSDEDGNRASYGFGGAVTTVDVGNIVPVGYGECLQGGFAISYRISAERVV